MTILAMTASGINYALALPRVSTLAGPRAFSVAGPLAWNQLPLTFNLTFFTLPYLTINL